MGNKDIIKQHLDGMAEKDKAFAERYANDAKNLDACMDYIMQRARKEATKGMAIIEDNIVYGWAAHYYQEDNLKDEKKEAKDKPKQEIATKVKISKKVKAEKKSEYIELDLFGGTV
jgi:hypothetical protein